MFEDEIHDRLRVVEAVGVVIAAGFVNDHDLATELLVALRDDERVFFRRHHLVSVADDVDQCDLRGSQWSSSSTGFFLYASASASSLKP